DPFSVESLLGSDVTGARWAGAAASALWSGVTCQERATISLRKSRTAATTAAIESATTYLVPSVSVTTVSGVASMRSIRSELSTNGFPDKRVNVIIERTILVLGF